MIYKDDVAGSSPVPPTFSKRSAARHGAPFIVLLACLMYRQVPAFQVLFYGLDAVPVAGEPHAAVLAQHLDTKGVIGARLVVICHPQLQRGVAFGRPLAEYC